MSAFKIFAGTSHPELSQTISKNLGLELGDLTITRFSCGETYVNINETVRGREVFVIQTSAQNVNDDLMELFLIVDALKRSFAEKVHLIMPHFGYARQDRKSRVREAISAKVMANLMEKVGVDHIITLNLHADQIQGFFDIPVDNISTRGFFADYFKQKNLDMNDVVVVSPDAGGVKPARKLADKLGCSLAMMHKHREDHNVSEVTAVIGDVQDKITILYDDIVDTGGSVCNAKKALIDKGARKDEVYLAATHPVFSGPAVDRLSQADFKEIVVTNSIPLAAEKQFSSLTVLDIGEFLANVILNISESKSVSQLHAK